MNKENIKENTMKPFEDGDIFLGCTYLNDENDDLLNRLFFTYVLFHW